MTRGYPLTPRTTSQLRAGQFWSIPLRDGRFGCGRVLRPGRGPSSRGRTYFTAAVLDWVGDEPPTVDSIASSRLLAVGYAHVRTISYGGGAILGERDFEADGLTPPDTITSHWGPNYPTFCLEQRFVEQDQEPRPERRNLRSPLTDAMLGPSPSGRGIVQFDRPLTDNDFRRVAEWLERYPQIGLRAYPSPEIRDLEFLRHFPRLRRFEVDTYELETADGLRHLPEQLEALALGSTRRRLELSILRRFQNLKYLHLDKQQKGIEVLSELTSLEELTLRSITLPDLSLLLPLGRLQSLALKLGGTRNLSLLPQVGRLRYLELWLIRGLSDVSSVGRLPELRFLFLQALKGVELLPGFGRANALRRIHLETMKGLHDLRPLASAPALEELVLIDMPQLQPDDLRPLVGLRQLKRVTAGLGSLRKNDEARALLGLPEVTGGFDWA